MSVTIVSMKKKSFTTSKSFLIVALKSYYPDSPSIWGLLHLGSNPVCRHQTLKFLLLPRGTCRQEPGVPIPWEVLPAIDQCICGCLEPPIRMISGIPVEELVEGLEDQRVIATPKKKKFAWPDHPVLPGTRPLTKEYTGRDLCHQIHM